MSVVDMLSGDFKAERERRVADFSSMNSEDVAMRVTAVVEKIIGRFREGIDDDDASFAILAGLSMLIEDIRAGERLRMRSAS